MHTVMKCLGKGVPREGGRGREGGNDVRLHLYNVHGYKIKELETIPTS